MILAEATAAAAASDPNELIKMILSYSTGIIGAAFGVVKHLQARRAKLDVPQPFKVKGERVYSPPTWDQHLNLERRVSKLEQEHKELRHDQALQFKEQMEAGHNRQISILDHIDKAISGVYERINQLGDRLPRTTRTKP